MCQQRLLTEFALFFLVPYGLKVGEHCCCCGRWFLAAELRQEVTSLHLLSLPPHGNVFMLHKCLLIMGVMIAPLAFVLLYQLGKPKP
jgi:hypothetical protein